MLYKDKYKERTPEETIKIIKDFFESRGMNIQSSMTKSEFGPYSHNIRLYYKQHVLQRSNGKGTSEIYSLASGLAELYERFCNVPNYIINGNMYKTYAKDDNFNKLNRKRKSSLDILENKYIENSIFPFAKDVVEKSEILNSLYGAPIYCNKYKNVMTGEEKYLPEYILYMLNGTNGCVAGNTFYEAFNQGFSEIKEREVAKAFLEGKYERLEVIKDEKIKNPLLKTYIENIKKRGFKIYIIDCYKMFNTPVVLTITVDPKSIRTKTTFGCFPVFDIALERSLTEMTQGIANIEDYNKANIQSPYKHQDKTTLVRNYFKSSSSSNGLQEDFESKLIYIDKENEGYLSSQEEHTNEEIYSYWLKYIKENNLNIYYSDNSLCKDMVALWLFEENAKPLLLDKENKISEYSRLGIQKVKKLNEITENISEAILRKYDFDKFEKNINLLTRIYTENEIAWYLDCCKMGFDFVSPYGNAFIMNLLDIKKQIIKEDGIWQDYDIDWFFIPYFKKYWMLRRYKEQKKYTDEEIINTGRLFQQQITKEDIDSWNNESYLLKKMIYEPAWSFIKSETYAEIINKYK